MADNRPAQPDLRGQKPVGLGSDLRSNFVGEGGEQPWELDVDDDVRCIHIDGAVNGLAEDADGEIEMIFLPGVIELGEFACVLALGVGDPFFDARAHLGLAESVGDGEGYRFGHGGFTKKRVCGSAMDYPCLDTVPWFRWSYGG